MKGRALNGKNECWSANEIPAVVTTASRPTTKRLHRAGSRSRAKSHQTPHIMRGAAAMENGNCSRTWSARAERPKISWFSAITIDRSRFPSQPADTNDAASAPNAQPAGSHALTLRPGRGLAAGVSGSSPTGYWCPGEGINLVGIMDLLFTASALSALIIFPSPVDARSSFSARPMHRRRCGAVCWCTATSSADTDLDTDDIGEDEVL